MFYYSQITYSSASISRKLLNNSSQPNLKLLSLDTALNCVKFTVFCVAQLYIYKTLNLRIPKRNVNNKVDN